MPSFSTSLSGLTANSQALSVIANNLANINTIAYKGSAPLFRELYYQQMGTSDWGTPIQLGSGTQIGSVAGHFQQGNVDTSGNPTDVAIQGEGFFVVERDGQRYYTRAGNFIVSPTGQLTTENGGVVLGYPAIDGQVSTDHALGALNVGSGQLYPARATTQLKIAMNLDGNAAVGTGFSTAAAVYDSLGASHVLNFNFTKTAAGAWDYAITIPAADVGGTGDPVEVASGTLQFDGNGKLSTPAADIAGIAVNNFANGASPLDFTWHLFDPSGASLVMQMAGTSTALKTEQDGFASGTLRDLNIRADGIIEGSFSNNQIMALGQIALANFGNVQGLTRLGGNNFGATLSSGAANIGVPGSGGRGTVAGSSLERSNVDIATEFAQLILAQRGYQANARAITTADEITQEAINLKR